MEREEIPWRDLVHLLDHVDEAFGDSIKKALTFYRLVVARRAEPLRTFEIAHCWPIRQDVDAKRAKLDMRHVENLAESMRKQGAARLGTKETRGGPLP
ncbi:MAG: hypothetical protein ABL977_02740 [Candidatus Eisenbacteria bacterium]